MSRVTFRGRSIELVDDESVLDALLREGEDVPYSCRGGTCHTCRLRATSGDLPEESQRGLKETQRAQGYFLARSCHPKTDLEIESEPDSLPFQGRVQEHDEIGEDIVRLRLRLDDELGYAPGQFVNLVREDGLVRSYSLASTPDADDLELHVRVIPGGRMSGWIREGLSVGDTVSVQGPFGSCFYVPGRPEQPMVLAGVGTGLAPLLGIARDALDRGHTGPIDLFHGALHASRLYHGHTLRALEDRFPSFRYHPCALHASGDAGDDIEIGPIRDIVLSKMADRLSEARIFLCGDPDFVNDLRKRLFLTGASLSEIHADPFTPAASATG